MNEPAIFIADFKNKCIREKVNNIGVGYSHDGDFEFSFSNKKEIGRTFPYPVKEDQDGKEIPESEFRLQHQYLALPDVNHEWLDCTGEDYRLTHHKYRRIIAIPIDNIGQTDHQYEEGEDLAEEAIKIFEHGSGISEYKKFDDKDMIIHGLEEGAEAWKSEYDNCRAILQQLVDLKDLKDSNEYLLSFSKKTFYETMKPQAWERAKEFLKKYQHGYE